MMLTEWKNINELAVVNNNGKVNMSKTFPLFGSVADVHSFLAVGTFEWLHNQSVIIRLAIHWDKASLPKDFRKYYYGYDAFYSNSSFLVSFFIHNNDQWEPLSNKPESLFQVNNQNELLSISTFTIQVHKKYLAKVRSNRIALPDFNKSQDGFIKLELSNPAYGFGTSLYPKAVAKAMMANANGKYKAMPAIPYIPLVKYLKVSYLNV